ncbi:unnamed protein product [Porites evermanni]|uniref:Uncharacterized protein n=1 Tax=Porites evermanni TaxID=104178 RepID=A0ABN8PUH1_9CNID|nr:unnamed protein product [Porites evermanni]
MEEKGEDDIGADDVETNHQSTSNIRQDPTSFKIFFFKVLFCSLIPSDLEFEALQVAKQILMPQILDYFLVLRKTSLVDKSLNLLCSTHNFWPYSH